MTWRWALVCAVAVVLAADPQPELVDDLDDTPLPDAPGSFVLEQSLGSDGAFVPRGTISVESLRTSSKGTIKQQPFTDEHRQQLVAAAREGDVVRIRLSQEGHAEEASVVSFVPACNLVTSDLMDSIAIYISQDLKLASVSYMTKEKVCRPNKQLVGKAGLRTRVAVVRSEDGPLPTTDDFKPAEQGEAIKGAPVGADGEPQKKEEASFLSKYWHLIAMGILWINLRANKGEEETDKKEDKKKE